jgi:hypothetical protein
LLPQTILLADRGYDADWIRELARQQGAWANIPPKRNRKDPICFSPYLYRARNLIERFFNKIKQCRRIATRYDKLAANYLAFMASCDFPRLIRLAGSRRTVENNLLFDMECLQSAQTLAFTIRVPASPKRFPIEIEILIGKEFRQLLSNGLQMIVNVVWFVTVRDLAEGFTNTRFVAFTRDAFVVVRK